jgi:cullin-associated NEDD8-dissociated protein 1
MVQCLASAARQGGKRIAPFLERVVPLVVASAQVDEDDELREAAVQCLEAFALASTELFAPHLSQVITMCLEYVAYDPNYNYDGDDDDDMDFGSDSDDDNDYDDDDDDLSWKVRRSAAEFLSAACSTQPALLAQYFTTVSNAPPQPSTLIHYPSS